MNKERAYSMFGVNLKEDELRLAKYLLDRAGRREWGFELFVKGSLNCFVIIRLELMKTLNLFGLSYKGRRKINPRSNV